MIIDAHVPDTLTPFLAGMRDISESSEFFFRILEEKTTDINKQEKRLITNEKVEIERDGEMDSIPNGKKRDEPVLGKLAWAIIGISVAVLIIVLAILATSSSNGQNPAVSLKDCSNQVLQYVNENLVQSGTSASIISTTEDHGLYGIKIQYQSQQITLYATKDCNLLFTNTYDMKSPTGSVNTAKTQPPPMKSERPEVDLYVMAFCPYGTQAETAMRPVVDLLGSKADIRLRYITTVTGSTTDTVDSLHGPTEAQEDLRQACIQKIAPEKLWDYISRFNEQCYPASSNQDTQKACWMNASTQTGIDSARIETCASGPEGISLLKIDEAGANRNGATGSPTLIINGVTYNGARTPEAYKQGICNSFNTTPAECTTTLSSSQASSVTGGC